jgi:hypothetical protein
MNVSEELRAIAKDLETIKACTLKRNTIPTEILTKADQLHHLCLSRKTITFKEAQNILSMPFRDLEKLAIILERGGLIELEYSI